MLQRAASNAYSWWWASHIRTKQSKWLEQSLQDMEEKVQHVIKLIEEDGDSFAKRAEMYYKKRPELLHFVEESYRAFRALAERYDHVSNDLQKANHTIATVFPEQVQFAIDEDDDCSPLKIPKNPQVPPENVPKVPKAPSKDSKASLTSGSKKVPAKQMLKTESTVKNVLKSGLSKSEALEEIDKLQKEILALQTVKEFVKNSYEIGLEKYWGIENQIMEMQQKVCSLQDEFGINTVIEDDEARTLMAKAALRSCQETLVQLQEKQEKSAQDAKEEYNKIEEIRPRIESLKNEYLGGEKDESKSSTQELDHTIQESRENETALDVAGSLESLTVSELVEKIDELAHKVINLGTEVSSQTVLINMLRTEVNDLQTQIRSLEGENDSGVNESCTLISKVKEMDDKFHMIEDLNKKVEKQNSNLEINFVKACSSLDHLSEKLTSIKLEEEVEVTNKLHLQDEEMKTENTKDVREEDINEQRLKEPVGNQQGQGKENLRTTKTENTKDAREEDKKEQTLDEPVCIEHDGEEVNLREMKIEDTKDVREDDTDKQDESVCNKQGEGEENAKESMEQVPVERSNENGDEDELDWQQKLWNGMEDREKILLTEYTTILRNFKDVKRKLSEMEKKEFESQSETQVQVQQLRDSISKRDEEIQHLRQKLNHLRETFSKTTSSQDQGIMEDLITAKEDDIKFVVIDQAPAISAAEEKLRMDIDAILDENLDFWLRFSTSFHLIQKFQAEVEDLQNEVSKIKEKRGVVTEVKSEARPIDKHLREIQTDLTMWLEQSVSLKDELKRRLESLCSIQEQITIALKEGVEEDEIKFSSHQAAKFQGEVVNMKQENNKVSEELQAGVDHVNALQQEIEKTLRKLNEEFDIQGDQARLPQSESRPRIPLRSFIFGTKQKKQKHSIFSAVLLNRRYHQAPRDGGAL